MCMFIWAVSFIPVDISKLYTTCCMVLVCTRSKRKILSARFHGYWVNMLFERFTRGDV